MNTALLQQIFSTDTPLLDVRAPVEFQQGAFPSAVNHPILNDQEREQVGICHKQHGPDAAEKLGYQLVKGTSRDERTGYWMDFLDNHPGAHLYCFRGGQRSAIAKQWIESAGGSIPRIEGGYKTMRNYLLGIFEKLPAITIVSGKTGVGKTILINEIQGSVDLEGFANHRGSAFGNRATPQPNQINFENAVAIAILKADGSLVLEDEGRMIGRLNLPLSLHGAMKSAPIVLLEDTLENRVERIYQEYIVDQIAELLVCKEQSPVQHLQQKYLAALLAIRKRLGGVAHTRISGLMEHAFAVHLKGDKNSQHQAHKDWIEQLLCLYYDPMYEYQINLKSERIIESGDRNSLRAYLESTSDARDISV